MNDINKQRLDSNSFLMRNMELSPDYVYLKYDIKIRWMQEASFESVKIMPKVCLNENIFSDTLITNESIRIDFEEWCVFLAKLSSAFKRDIMIRKKIAESINVTLDNYEKEIHRVEKKLKNNNKVSKEDLNCLIKMFAMADSFSIFNIIIPKDWYCKMFMEIGLSEHKISIDDFLLCMFMPHRTEIRKEKLILAKELLINNSISHENMKNFTENYLIYEDFENWCFDDTKLNDYRYILRDIKHIAKYNSIQEIISEIEHIDNKRKIKLERHSELLKLVAEYSDKYNTKLETRNLLESLSFLSLITTEEERRHKLECKHCILIGKIAKLLKIDIGRATIKEILDTTHSLWD